MGRGRVTYGEVWGMGRVTYGEEWGGVELHYGEVWGMGRVTYGEVRGGVELHMGRYGEGVELLPANIVVRSAYRARSAACPTLEQSSIMTHFSSHLRPVVIVIFFISIT